MELWRERAPDPRVDLRKANTIPTCASATDKSCMKGHRYADPVLLSQLFGVADNNPFGLKVYAFLKLCGLAFRHEHIFDASKAPRGQLPYLVDGDTTIGDSDTIISHLISRHDLTIDKALTASQRNTDLLVRRMLDDLYWVMSYSRWKDDRFWPLFRDAILRLIPMSRPSRWRQRGNTTSSATTSRASDAMSPLLPMPEVSPTFGFWRTCFRGADFCSVKNRAAPMPGSMGSPQIFTSMRSTRPCKSFSFPSQTSSCTANRCTPLCRDEPPDGTAASR